MQGLDSIPAEGGAQRRRPLVGLALAAACGCCLPRVPVGSIPALAALASLLTALSFPVGRRPRGFFPYAACAASFALAARLLDPALDARSIERQLPRRPGHAEVVGIVAGEPVESQARDGGTVWKFPLQLESLRAVGGWRSTESRIRVTWVPGAAEGRPALGDRWSAGGLLRDPLPGARSRELSLRAEGPAARRRNTAVAYPFLRWCERGRAWCAAVLGRGLDTRPREAAMLRALVLGYREDLSSDLFQAFSRTGTLHVVAVSGSHVAIFAGILAAFLRASGLPRTRWFLLLAPALLLYSCSTGLAPSAIRACIMAMIYWAASLFGRQPDGPTALAASALLLLGWDPGQVHDPGFVLSFVAVGGLMMFYPRLRDLLAPVSEKRVEGTVEAEGWGRRACRLAVLPAGRLLAASLAAWLVTTPLTVQYFNLLSPSGLVLNLIAIPLAGGVLFAGTMSIFTAFLPAFVSESFNHAAGLLVAFLVGSVDAVDGWPGSYFYLPAPGPFWLAGWAAALILLFFGRAAVRRRCALVLCCAGAWCARDLVRDRSVDGVVWAREETLQSFIDLPGDGDVLVDAGRSYRARELLRGLREQGVDRLAVVVLTRPLADSLGALVALLQEVPVGEIWCAAGPDRSPVARAAWVEAARLGVPVKRFRAAAEGTWPGEAQWRAMPDPATGALSFRVARGPACLSWRVEGGAERPVRLDIVEDPVRRGAARSLVAGDQRALDDGHMLHWSFADDRSWRAGRPAVRLRAE